jgi:hypothetical protein
MPAVIEEISKVVEAKLHSFNAVGKARP